MLQDYLRTLLTKYELPDSAVMADGDTVLVDGKRYPLFAHRYERRFVEMRRLLHDGTVTGLSALRCGRITARSVPLMDTIRRELDLCRFLTGHEIVSVTAFLRDDRAGMLLAEMDDGVVASIETANTLPDGAEPIDKHEAIGARGLVCDRVVDTQIPQRSIYLYADEDSSFTDVDFELYGLGAQDVSAVRAAFALVKDTARREDVLRDSAILDRLMECAVESAKNGEKAIVRGGERWKS